MRTILSLLKGCLLFICMLGVMTGGLCSLIAVKCGASGGGNWILPISGPVFLFIADCGRRIAQTWRQ